MNLAILQPVPDARAARCPYRHDVAALAAALRARGHNVTLTILETCDESAVAAAAGGARPACQVVAGRPDLVFLYIESLAADLAVRMAGVIAQVHGSPLVPFGPHASRRPDECLSLPGAEAVAIGPTDLVAPDYVATRAGLDYLRTPGFWIKCETGIMRNPLPRAPEPPADAPLPARDLYPSDRLVDPAGFAEVRVARGGEAGAATADAPAQTPPGGPCWPPTAAWPVRHRPVESVILEMLQMADALLDLGGFRIDNERWASSLAWLAAFAERYARQVGMPLRTTLYAPDVSPQAAALLARAGCEEVRLPLGSGTALIRHDVLGLNVSAEAAEAAVAALRGAGVRAVACVEIGTPYETPTSLEQTVEFLRRLDPDRVEAAMHYPAPGTPSDRIARENGWLVPDPASAHLAGRPAVALPRLSADDLVTAREELPFAVLRPRIVPLIRLGRRVRIGNRGTLYDLVVKPFLAPPVRRR
jgi:hypothetical protein